MLTLTQGAFPRVPRRSLKTAVGCLRGRTFSYFHKYNYLIIILFCSILDIDTPPPKKHHNFSGNICNKLEPEIVSKQADVTEIVFVDNICGRQKQWTLSARCI